MVKFKISVFGLVGANIDVALAPAKIYEYHKNPAVVAVPLEEEITSIIVLIYPRNRKLSSAATAFIEYLEKRSPQ